MPIFQDANEWDALVVYLLSDDTRLPSHPLLKAKAADSADYDTYTGEEVWQQRSGSEADGPGENGVPPFTPVVELVAASMVALTRGVPKADPSFGVVLCGEYETAADVPWATSTRTLRCYSPRDVWQLLRTSSSLLCDFDRQVAGCGSNKISFHLRKHVDVHEETEFSVFLTLSDSAAISFLGVCQRSVDRVLTGLAQLSRNENGALFRDIYSKLSDVSMEAFWSAIASTEAAPSENAQQRLVRVDVVHQRGTCPTFVVGCKRIDVAADVPLDGACDSAESVNSSATFRLFQTYEGLMEHYALEGSSPDRTVFVATSADDLCFDAGKNRNSGLPAEFVDPQLLQEAGLPTAALEALLSQQKAEEN